MKKTELEYNLLPEYDIRAESGERVNPDYISSYVETVYEVESYAIVIMTRQQWRIYYNAINRETGTTEEWDAAKQRMLSGQVVIKEMEE